MCDTKSVNAAPLSSLAPWFGGKRTLAPRIVEELGPHCAYWEPFCGSCAVLFAKPPLAFETVNDLHGDLVNLAMVVASPRYIDLVDLAYRTLAAEDLFRHHRGELAIPFTPPASPAGVEDRHVARALSMLVVSWQGLNGTAGTRSYNQHWSVRWTPSGGRWGWTKMPESIPFWHQRLRNVTILHRDAFDVIENIGDRNGVAIYCDPPYLKKSDKYEHDFAPADHERLAAALARFRLARVVVSYYDHPRLHELYRGWTLRALPIRQNLKHSAGNRAGVAMAPEVLLMNGPSLAPKEFLDFERPTDAP